MVDPITAFAAAQAAVAGVKAAVSLYKDAKAVGKDVGAIASEITHGLGKFFEAQEAVCKAGQDIEGKVIKTKSVDMQAFENVMRVRQLQEYERELKELLIYHTPMAGVWEDFQLERQKIREKKAEEDAQQRRLEAKQRKLRQEFEEKIVLYGVIFGSVLFAVSVISYMFYWIAEQSGR